MKSHRVPEWWINLQGLLLVRKTAMIFKDHCCVSLFFSTLIDVPLCLGQTPLSQFFLLDFWANRELWLTIQGSRDMMSVSSSLLSPSMTKGGVHRDLTWCVCVWLLDSSNIYQHTRNERQEHQIIFLATRAERTEMCSIKISYRSQTHSAESFIFISIKEVPTYMNVADLKGGDKQQQQYLHDRFTQE